MKCANCANNAQYVYRITLDTAIYYCPKDLPSFLETRRKAGLLQITEKHKAAVAETLKTFEKAPSLEPVEEPTVEDSETPKPVKKATKKTEE